MKIFSRYKKNNAKVYKLSTDQKRILEAYFYISPFLIGLAMFFIIPIFISIKLSFGTVVKMQGFIIEWSGFEHYIRAFIIDTNFVPMFLKVIRQVLSRLPLIIIFSLLIAVLINKNIGMRGFFRIVFFLPFLLGTGNVLQKVLQQGIDKQVLAAVLFTIVPRDILAYLGSQVVTYVENFFSEIVIILWSSSVQILLFLSGLQGIPTSLYESSKVDGATEFDMFWKITVPMIAPMALLNVVYTIVDSFANVTNPILSYIQDQAFKQTRFEYAAAIGWIYFVFIIILVLIVIGAITHYINKSEKAW